MSTTHSRQTKSVAMATCKKTGRLGVRTSDKPHENVCGLQWGLVHQFTPLKASKSLPPPQGCDDDDDCGGGVSARMPMNSSKDRVRLSPCILWK